MKLSEKLSRCRADRPDERGMAEFIREAEVLEGRYETLFSLFEDGFNSGSEHDLEEWEEYAKRFISEEQDKPT